MLFRTLSIIGSWLLELLALLSQSDHDKDLELLILRHQIGILNRNVKRPKASRLEKLFLALLTHRLQERSNASYRQLRRALLIFTPRTVLGWHKELVRRKWTYKHNRLPGRPRTASEIEALVVRIARENPRSGYGKIEGELLKPGYVVPQSTIRVILRRHGIPPAPIRGDSSWRTFRNHYKDQMLACDFFTVETVMLQTIYVFFFIELAYGQKTSSAVHFSRVQPSVADRIVVFRYQKGDGICFGLL